MDVLIGYTEFEDGSFPDCCARCGANETELTDVTLTQGISPVGGAFEYSHVVLPLCPRHQKPPTISLSYLGIRKTTPRGVVVKNVCVEFVEALEKHRERFPPRQTTPARHASVSSPISPQQEQAYWRFVVFALLGAILLGIVISMLVVMLSKQKQEPTAIDQTSQPNAPSRRATEHDLPGENDSPRFP